jgi:hypothetical protein
MDEIRALLHDTQEQLRTVHLIYKECQDSGVVSPRLGPRVKNVIENQRSALDYIAVLIHAKCGRPSSAKIYFPFSTAPENFERDIDRRMPGVRGKRPDIADLIRDNQPFDKEWMRWLEKLRNESGHNRLNRHSASELPQTRMKLPSGEEPVMYSFQFEGEDGTYPVEGKVIGMESTQGIGVEWTFEEPPLPIPSTLSAMQMQVWLLTEKLAQSADL